MSTPIKFVSDEVVVLVPKNHSIPASTLAGMICPIHPTPIPAGKCSGTYGLLSFQFFEYTDIDAVLKHMFKEKVIVIVTPESIGHTPQNEMEYSDRLNELFTAKPYMVMSISPLHVNHTEQRKSRYLTHIIRDRPQSEACYLNSIVKDLYNSGNIAGTWYVCSDVATYVATTCVIMTYN